MEYLIRIAEEYGLKKIVDQVVEHPAVQGVVIDIHPLWLIAWHNRWTGYPDDWWIRRWDRFLFIPDWSFFESIEFGTTGTPNLYWKPPYWEELPGDPSVPPLLVKVCLRPSEKEIEKEIKFDFSKERLRVVLESRPLARLASDPKAVTRPLVGGISVGTGSTKVGTLGGILRNDKGHKFALTCSHVLDKADPVYHPAQIDSKSAIQIGHVVHTSVLQKSESLAPCNPYSTTNILNEFDLALIKLNSNMQSKFEILDIGPIHGLTPNTAMTPGLAVEVTGRTSGYRRLKIGGIAVFYKFIDSIGESYCFKNLFEIRWPSFFKLIIVRPISAGDSGAWVCAQGTTGTEWCGTVVGEDRLQGYAMLSENIQSWLGSEGYTLVCDQNSSEEKERTSLSTVNSEQSPKIIDEENWVNIGGVKLKKRKRSE